MAAGPKLDINITEKDLPHRPRDAKEMAYGNAAAKAGAQQAYSAGYQRGANVTAGVAVKAVRDATRQLAEADRKLAAMAARIEALEKAKEK